LATATILHGEAPYRNCIATGRGLDENGLKMSKSKGNVLDPWSYIDRFGADCIRWYLFSSSAPWKSKRVTEVAVQEPLYKFLDTVRNTYDFFALYATIDGYDPAVHRADGAGRSALDRWIRSRQETTTRAVVDALDAYDIVSATAAVEAFVDDLSNWYVRLSRRRFWRGGMGDDKAAAYATLRGALLVLSRLLAPFVPFLAEAVYRPLRGPDDPESVHYCAYPAADGGAIDAALEAEMLLARSITALGHEARNQAQIKVRQPLAHAVVASSSEAVLRDEVRALIERELNVRRVDVVPDLGAYLVESAAPNFRSIGPRLGASGPKAAAWIKAQGASALRSALAAGAVTVRLGEEDVEVRPEDVTYTASLSEGYVQVESGTDRLLLDVRIDDELRRQGLFRDVVHRIQVARKDAGFDVTDRIRLAYQADPALGAILADHEEEIAAEVLAVKVERGVRGDHEYRETIELDGEQRVEIGLSRVRDA
ncbi:MAG: DUF5915 domain-containing protein, partial [Candidatus Bipolaricaulis sp.]|nr:DUF5915 domain-containing protein [Candidatus Bipolaricaulis sp.]